MFTGDWRKNYHLRAIMDEVFGLENFINEIIWKRTTAHGDARPSRGIDQEQAG